MMLSKVIWKISGPRELVKVEEVADLEFPEDSQPHTIDISCRVWTVDVLKAIPFNMEALKNVKILKIEDIIASLETETGLATLGYVAEFFAEHCPNIEQVYLNDNAIGTRGIERLRPLLTRNLTHLFLRNTGIAEADAIILKGILPAESLISLDFSRNTLGNGAQHFADLVARCTNLESFAYAGTRCTSAGFRAILESLAQLPKLKYLDVEDGSVGKNDLLPCLRNWKQLKHLILEGNDIGIEKLADILEGLSGIELETLNLSGNDDFDSEGGELLKKYLKRAPRTLRSLKLSCAMLGNEGTAAVLEGLRDGHQVEDLDLSQNLIEDGAMFLPPLVGVKRLNLRDNMDLEGFADIAKAYGETTIVVDEDMMEELDDDLVAALGNLNI